MSNCRFRTKAHSFWCWMQKRLKIWDVLKYISTSHMVFMGLFKQNTEQQF